MPLEHDRDRVELRIGCVLLGFAALLALVGGCRVAFPWGFRVGAASGDAAIVAGRIAVLLASGVVATLAVGALARGRRRTAVALVLATAVLGAGSIALGMLDVGARLALLGGRLGPFAWTHGVAQFCVLHVGTVGVHLLATAAGVGALVGLVAAGAPRPAVLETCVRWWHAVVVGWLFAAALFDGST